MATVTRTYSSTSGPSASWTFYFSDNNVPDIIENQDAETMWGHYDAFIIPPLSETVKISCSSGFDSGQCGGGYEVRCTALNYSSLGAHALSSTMYNGNTYTVPVASGVSDLPDTMSVDSYFTTEDQVTRTYTLNYVLTYHNGAIWKGAAQSISTFAWEGGSDTLFTKTLRLNAPPEFVSSDIEISGNYQTIYSDLTPLSIKVGSLQAQYGGYCQSISLTVGNNTVSVTPNHEQRTAGLPDPYTYIADTTDYMLTSDISVLTWKDYYVITTTYGEVDWLEPGNNPSEFGLYELVSGQYVLTSDTTYNSSKTYYERYDEYTKVENPTGNPTTHGWYELGPFYTLTLTPTVYGTNITPVVTVTDSRGQVSTKELTPITIEQYNLPSVSFAVDRFNNTSKQKDEEGKYVLVTADFYHTRAVTNLTQPTVTVKSGTTTYTPTVTWYTDSTVQTAVSWTNYNPSSPVTLYGIISIGNDGGFDVEKSYDITILPKDNEKSGTAITQTISLAFYTIDFQAGGKEIAFGGLANDDVSDYPEGLFKCAMSFKLKDNLFWVGTRSEYEQAVSDDKMPEHTIVFITDETADYIVEQGSNSNGTYRKWNSGVLEQWGHTTIGSNSAATWYYPTSFISANNVEMVASCHYLSTGTYVAPTISVQPIYTDRAYVYARVSTSTVTNAHTVSCYAIGKWK